MDINCIKRLVCKSLVLVYMMTFNVSLGATNNISSELNDKNSTISEAKIKKENNNLGIWNKYKNVVARIGTIGIAGIMVSCGTIALKHINNNENVDLIKNDGVNKWKKICLLGNNDYSKVALSNNFSPELYISYETTVSQAEFLSKSFIDAKSIQEKINGEEEKVTIMCISSNKEYLNLYPIFLKNSEVNVLVYDSEATEVDDLKPWLDVIKKEDGTSKKVMAVGTYYGYKEELMMKEDDLRKACEERGLELKKPIYIIDKYNIKDDEEFKNFKEGIINELGKVEDE